MDELFLVNLNKSKNELKNQNRVMLFIEGITLISQEILDNNIDYRR